MTGKRKRARRVPSVVLKAEKALQIAVENTIEEHRLSGDPIVVWENGRVVKIPASKIPRKKSRRRPRQ
ncbi:MAG: hypothetical protein CO113_08365 [Elusimicrobia bacterium CG_4_9_14_3_um_filter_62_55]|nr:MAG: hypothetical protein COR54_03980 [Elusimicrobia bacterium CG22_combo_CG10-13_8_21_14_all_63_91]PJB25510.1 MAG: hypothetical protein CO113_08365 [Elusimicrobia bacterium CG_4_9_14_3_um_filter_62_55]